MRRGTVLHRLLEMLPDIDAAERRAAGQRALDRLTPEWPEDKRDQLLEEILAILEAPAFAAVFGPDSRAETGIAGRLVADGPLLVGQIDRLAVTDHEVLIVDYKTDRLVPDTPGEVSPAYLAQIAAYQALARQVWPGRAVRVALLWTAGPTLMELPASLLEAHSGIAPP
jgi:ATP-dependent helicase/nuclease subunit A